MKFKMIRFFDVLITIILLIILSPIILIIPILILILDGRPIIYKQLRIGYNGRKFNIYKFRTMSNKFFKNESLRLTDLGKILEQV